MTPIPFGVDIGPIITGRNVELAAVAMLKRWSGTYLAEMERQTQRNPGSLPRVRAWTTSPDFETWPEDQIPRVLIVSPGLLQPPAAGGEGTYRATWSLGIGVIVSARTMDETTELAKLYCAALRACMLQHQSLEGFAAGVEWLDENYDDLPSIDTRSLGAGQAIFAVQVDDVTRRWGGPVTPSEPPDPDTVPLPTDPTVEDVAVEVQRIP
jgi:hypothetical protein